MRAFIALDLKEFAEPLNQTIGKLKSAGLHLNYVRPDHAHLTLAFFEDISESNIEKLVEELTEKLIHSSFEISLSLGNVGAFPDQRKPTVLWREIVDGRDDLSRLKKHVDEALTLLELPVEKRPFKPHLTLARIREKNHTPIPEFVFSMPLTHSNTISIKKISFFKSEPSPHGPRYTALYRIPLRKDG